LPSWALPRVSRSRSFTGVNLTRSCTVGAFAPFASGVCTEASRSCCTAPSVLAEATERIRDAELSACCTVASSRSAYASLRKLRPSGVDGSGMAQIRSAAAVIFWLALGKPRGLPSRPSAMISYWTARPASRAFVPRPACSCSRVRHSFCVCRRSSSSLASSSRSYAS